jgi:hypothetical protein
MADTATTPSVPVLSNYQRRRNDEAVASGLPIPHPPADTVLATNADGEQVAVSGDMGDVGGESTRKSRSARTAATAAKVPTTRTASTSRTTATKSRKH